MKVTKQDFIKSLETTLILADADVLSLELEDDETVIIYFIGGGKRRVNIAMDSHLSIAKDVMKGIS
jgi:hypothetical protein